MKIQLHRKAPWHQQCCAGGSKLSALPEAAPQNSIFPIPCRPHLLVLSPHPPRFSTLHCASGVLASTTAASLPADLCSALCSFHICMHLNATAAAPQLSSEEGVRVAGSGLHWQGIPMK